MAIFYNMKEESFSSELLKESMITMENTYDICLMGDMCTKLHIAEDLVKAQQKTDNIAFHGFWTLVDNLIHPRDARVEYVYFPTYYALSMLVNAYLYGLKDEVPDLEDSIKFGMDACCNNKLSGHGYDSFRQLLQTLQIFGNAGVFEFIKLYPEFHPEFTQMLDEIISKLSVSIFEIGYDEKYLNKIYKILELYQAPFYIFVYGTLRHGERNHKMICKNNYLGKGKVYGFKLYDTGFGYPGICFDYKEENCLEISGEVYEIEDMEQLEQLDRLEGNGVLYERHMTTVCMKDNRLVRALVYVYKKAE